MSFWQDMVAAHSDKIDPDRAANFEAFFDLLEARQAKVLLETGTMRRADSFLAGGGMTYWLAQFARRFGGSLTTVDVDGDGQAIGRKVVGDDRVLYLHDDSVLHLRSSLELIDGLYLDSFDSYPEQIREAQLHQLAEVQAALRRLHARSVIGLDDWHGRERGKGGLSVPFLIEHGWRLVPLKNPPKMIANSYERTVDCEPTAVIVRADPTKEATPASAPEIAAAPKIPRGSTGVRFAGLMMIHEHSPLGFEELVIGELARHVDQLFVFQNKGAPESWIKAAKACPKLAGYREGEVAQGSQKEGPVVLRLLDEAQPEFFAYLDSDEILPPKVEEILDEMDRAGKRCVEFPVLACVGDADHVIATPEIHQRFHAPHVKIAVWRPGLDRKSSIGFDYPTEDYAGHAYRSPWPLRHLYVVNARQWRQRWQYKPQPWMLEPWPVMAYDPNRKSA